MNTSVQKTHRVRRSEVKIILQMCLWHWKFKAFANGHCLNHIFLNETIVKLIQRYFATASFFCGCGCGRYGAFYSNSIRSKILFDKLWHKFVVFWHWNWRSFSTCFPYLIRTFFTTRVASLPNTRSLIGFSCSQRP